MIEHIHPLGEPTPTVAELYERRDGSAEVNVWTAGSKTEPGKPSIYRLLPKGQAVITAIAQRNAAGTLARGSAADEAGAALVKAQTEGGSENGSKSKSSPS